MAWIVSIILVFSIASAGTIDSKKSKKNFSTSYADLEEFAKEWNPPLTGQEKSFLEPEFSKDSTRFRFNKEAEVRGLSCMENVLIRTNKDSLNFEVVTSSGTTPPQRCKYKEFTFSGLAIFRKKDFKLISLHVDYPSSDSSILNNIRGMRFGKAEFYFGDEKKVEKRLIGTPLQKKKYYIISNDFESSPVLHLMIAEPIKIFNVLFPAGSKISTDRGYASNGKDIVELIDIVLLPNGDEVFFQGVACDRILFAGEDLLECDTTKPIILKNFVIPPKSKVLFDPKLKKNGVAQPAVILSCPKGTKMNGVDFDQAGYQLIVDGVLTNKPPGARTGELYDLRNPGI